MDLPGANVEIEIRPAILFPALIIHGSLLLLMVVPVHLCSIPAYAAGIDPHLSQVRLISPPARLSAPPWSARSRRRAACCGWCRGSAPSAQGWAAARPWQ